MTFGYRTEFLSNLQSRLIKNICLCRDEFNICLPCSALVINHDSSL